MEKIRKFVIGDIHSHFDELMELFDMVQFDFDNDSLISLGDLVDRGAKPIEVIETMMKVKNFIHILGNHDEWCYQYLLNKTKSETWIVQGGQSTFDAYEKNPEFRDRHYSFFKKAKLFHIDDANRLFIHGGYNPSIPFNLQQKNKKLFIWDRSLVEKAKEYDQTSQRFSEFSEIFVGHTPTQIMNETVPKKISNLWMLDTGVHLEGKLTIMNIETKEFWQSSVFE